MRLITLLLCLVFQMFGLAQTVNEPIFDRSDVSAFRVEKVHFLHDTTLVYCIYHAKEFSSASVSDNTYIENVKDCTRVSILKAIGMPFSPNRKSSIDADSIRVVLLFPHIGAEKINLIGNIDNKSLGIYGIDLNKSYDSTYTDKDIDISYITAKSYEEKEDWHSAVEWSLKQLKSSQYVYGMRSKEAAWPMYNLTMQYAELNDWNKMIEWGEQAIDILRETPQDSLSLDVLARAYGNVGTAYSMLKQPEIAKRYLILSLEARKKIGPLDNYKSYVEYLQYLATLFYYKGDYPHALMYQKELTAIYERKFREDRKKYGCRYVNSLNNLCIFYSNMHQYDEAYKIGKLSMALIEEGVCQDYKLDVLSALANALAYVGQIDEAIKYYENILAESDSLIMNEEWSTQTRLVVNSKIQLASLLLTSNNDTLRATNELESILQYLEKEYTSGEPHYDEHVAVLYALSIWWGRDKNIGTQYFKRAIHLMEEWQGESVKYTKLLYLHLFKTFDSPINKDNNDSLYCVVKKLSDIIKRHVNTASPTMSRINRSKYWSFFQPLFKWIIPTLSHRANEDKWSALAYDAALFNKGMLLESETEFKKSVFSSNDSTLQHLYSNYIQDLSLLERIYSNSYTNSDVDSLRTKIQEEEYLLSRNVSSLNRQYKGSSYSWTEIRDKLGDNDIAIEIISYVGPNDSSFCYDAYAITNKSNAPKLIPLFDDIIFRNDLLSDDEIKMKLSSLIWKNDSLLCLIENRNNIYFSTDGLLSLTALEYLPISHNIYANEKYNLFRVSSTRELCSTNSITVKDVCLYGGLDYNCSPGLINYQVTNSRISRSIRDVLVSRGGFETLYGSKQEIEQIKQLLEKKHLHSIVYKGAEGTEGSIKKISGSEINILHLSTHGMYISDEDYQLRGTNNYRFILPNESNVVDEEQKPLSRSFLVMAGGNSLIRRDSIATETEDGILTALEISHLDFTNLDLVVLSACETAMGMNSFDGVLGLQRGFKKAGANTILMSLDKVDDEATRILMVEFYRNLMNGKTKHQSLQDAQKYLRKVDNGKYDDPKYWASFIMLDGLK